MNSIEKQVSVLVTFYNQKKYVDKAIESIISQKGCTYEIVIGDDGSNDGTVEKINHWVERFPEIISLYVMDRKTGTNIPGFRASRNRLSLLEHVKGKYFIFLDGDDYFTSPDKLRKQIEILDNPDNSDCSACGHNIMGLFSDGNTKPFAPESFCEGKYTLTEYWERYYVHTDTLLIRSSLIKDIPYNLVETDYNDNTITFLSLQSGKLYYMKDTMAVYLQTGDGIWTGKNKMVNLIRNMMLYDICNKINAAIWRSTDKRLHMTWSELYKNRKNILFEELADYYKDAVDKELKYTKKWIMYNSLSKQEKRKLFEKYTIIFFNSKILGIRYRLKNTIKQRK